jgi:hypothetical protein
VALPYALIDSLPLVGVSRTPGRINETTFFALAVLVGFGFSTLHRHLTRGWLSSIVVGILAVGILFEMLVRWPFPLANAEVPGVVQAIAAEDDTGALLHVPPFSEAIQKNIALHYQTVHERPIVGGWIHRPLPEAEPWEATFFRLVRTDRAGEDIVASPDLAQRRAWLHHLDIDYVIVQKVKMADAKANKYRLLIEELLGPTAMEDEALAAFQVPPRAPDPADAVLYSFSEDGWNNPEQDGGIWRRWMYNDGRLYIYSIREETGCLQFTVDSHLDFPLLEVYQGEELLDTFVAGDRTTHATQPITLTKGMNVIRFHAPGGCPEVLDDPRCWSEALLAPPEHDPTLPCDARATCRTFVFDHVAFVPADELAIGQSMNVNFGNQMRLRGWALDERTLHPGGVLTATLTWEAAVELSDRYVVFAHLLSSDGELVAQYDDAPVGKALPRDAWPPGATFKYPLAVELPGDLSAGEYRLYVGVYLWPDVERLLVLSDVPGAENDAVELSGVEIAP